jgi:hypothetical protein
MNKTGLCACVMLMLKWMLMRSCELDNRLQVINCVDQ